MIRDDLEHKLLSGKTIDINGCPTYSITLGDMADYGFSIMQNVISLMASDDASASKLLKGIEGKVSTFYVLVVGMMQETQQDMSQCKEPKALLCNAIPNFLSLFFRQKVYFDNNLGFVIKNDADDVVFVLNEESYDDFRKILKHRNCLSDLADIEDENPANDMAAKLLAKKKELQAKLRKAKSNNNEDGISMADLISIFAEAESMPLQDVYQNYDVYQFNNQFNRLKIMDDYKVNIQALIAGAKSEDVKLQHWISKIKNDDR